MKLSLARILRPTALAVAALALGLATPAFAQSHQGHVPPPTDGGAELEDPTEGAPAPEIAPAAFGGLVLLVVGGALLLNSRRVRAEAR